MAWLDAPFDPSAVAPFTGNVAVAMRMARAGLTVFPCDWKAKPDNQSSPTKRPLVLHWKEDATDDPEQILKWWRRWPNALVGLPVGAHGLIVIDADRHGGPDGVADFERLAADRGLPPGPLVETLSGGRHYYFTQPTSKTLGNSEGALKKRGINIRGAGGYVIAPGTSWINGDSYRDIGPQTVADAFEADSIPELPSWIIALLEPRPEPIAAPSKQRPPSPASDRREEAYARAALDAECAEVATTGQGSRNNALNKAAFAAGTMIGAGWIGRCECESALLAAAAACGLKGWEARATIKSGLNAGEKKPREPLAENEIAEFLNPQPRRVIVEDGVTADAETGEIIETRPAPTTSPPWLKKAPVDAGGWDDPDPMSCPGLVGRIANWIVGSADFQQPLLATGAALTVIGTVAGRQLAGPTRSGTHLYVIGVASTGSGKDHPLKSIGRILIASKLSQLIGADGFKSERAIFNTITRSPACVCAMDEFGAFLSRGKSRQASTHEQGVSAKLRTLWGSSFEAVATSEMATAKFELIHSPAMSIYGTSTADEFYDALSDQDTRNGLLNRFLILENLARPERSKPRFDRSEVPADIVDGIRAIYWRLGEQAAAPYHGQGTTPCALPEGVQWRDGAAEEIFDRFQKFITQWMDAEPENERYLVRTVEMAVRIATIRAVGVDARLPSVSADDMLWGASLAVRSVKAMIEGARDRIAENDRQRWTNRIVQVIKHRGVARIRDIQMSIKGALRSNDLKDIIASLVESERVEIVEIAEHKQSPGKKLLGYRLRNV